MLGACRWLILTLLSPISPRDGAQYNMKRRKQTKSEKEDLTLPWQLMSKLEYEDRCFLCCYLCGAPASMAYRLSRPTEANNHSIATIASRLLNKAELQWALFQIQRAFHWSTLTIRNNVVTQLEQKRPNFRWMKPYKRAKCFNDYKTQDYNKNLSNEDGE